MGSSPVRVTTLNLNRNSFLRNRFRFFVLYEKPGDKQLLSERANILIKVRALTNVRALCNRTIQINIAMIVEENNFIDEIIDEYLRLPWETKQSKTNVLRQRRSVALQQDDAAPHAALSRGESQQSPIQTEIGRSMIGVF